MSRDDGFIPSNQLRRMPSAPVMRVEQRDRLSFVENCFHLFMTINTLGLWGFVWAARSRAVRNRWR